MNPGSSKEHCENQDAISMALLQVRAALDALINAEKVLVGIQSSKSIKTSNDLISKGQLATLPNILTRSEEVPSSSPLSSPVSECNVHFHDTQNPKVSLDSIHVGALSRSTSWHGTLSRLDRILEEDVDEDQTKAKNTNNNPYDAVFLERAHRTCHSFKCLASRQTKEACVQTSDAEPKPTSLPSFFSSDAFSQMQVLFNQSGMDGTVRNTPSKSDDHDDVETALSTITPDTTFNLGEMVGFQLAEEISNARKEEPRGIMSCDKQASDHLLAARSNHSLAASASSTTPPLVVVKRQGDVLQSSLLSQDGQHVSERNPTHGLRIYPSTSCSSSNYQDDFHPAVDEEHDNYRQANLPLSPQIPPTGTLTLPRDSFDSISQQEEELIDQDTNIDTCSTFPNHARTPTSEYGAILERNGSLEQEESTSYCSSLTFMHPRRAPPPPPKPERAYTGPNAETKKSIPTSSPNKTLFWRSHHSSVGSQISTVSASVGSNSSTFGLDHLKISNKLKPKRFSSGSNSSSKSLTQLKSSQTEDKTLLSPTPFRSLRNLVKKRFVSKSNSENVQVDSVPQTLLQLSKASSLIDKKVDNATSKNHSSEPEKEVKSEQGRSNPNVNHARLDPRKTSFTSQSRPEVDGNIGSELHASAINSSTGNLSKRMITPYQRPQQIFQSTSQHTAERPTFRATELNYVSCNGKTSSQSLNRNYSQMEARTKYKVGRTAFSLDGRRPSNCELKEEEEKVNASLWQVESRLPRHEHRYHHHRHQAEQFPNDAIADSRFEFSKANNDSKPFVNGQETPRQSTSRGLEVPLDDFRFSRASSDADTGYLNPFALEDALCSAVEDVEFGHQ